MHVEAADLIESLQAQLVEKTEDAEQWRVLRLDADRIREGMMQKEMCLISENIRLEAQLSASQRREKAAVEALRLSIANHSADENQVARLMKRFLSEASDPQEAGEVSYQNVYDTSKHPQQAGEEK